MENKLVKCWECQRDHFPNQLKDASVQVTITKKVCPDCLSGPSETMLDIETNKRSAARATAWNQGRGWVV